MAALPASPAYILRGHASPIHATAFIRSNSRLVTGDAEGYIVVWMLATKRPVAVWQAHEASVMGVRAWGSEKLITHGKDNKLIVWRFSEDDEPSMSLVLPIDTPPETRKQPWVLHILHVNTMNFCSFSQEAIPGANQDDASSEELLIAVPNTMSSETVDIFHLPTTKRIHTVPGSTSFKGGMIMALGIFHQPANGYLTVIAGYESGHTSISQLSGSPMPSWGTIYVAQAHTQPILSLDVSPAKDFYFTSSADATIAKHSIPVPGSTSGSNMTKDIPLKTLQTKHSGQQSLRLRNDGKIFATAGWDSRVRVYSTKTMKELAVLKWHKEGCYSIAFADMAVSVELPENGTGGESKELVKTAGTMTVKEARENKARTTHWLAAGSKDGKISLWDIY